MVFSDFRGQSFLLDLGSQHILERYFADFILGSGQTFQVRQEVQRVPSTSTP